MGLIADALAEHTHPPGAPRPCTVQRAIDAKLDPDDRAEVDEYIAAVREWRETSGQRNNGKLNATRLHGLLGELGVVSRLETVRDHVSGGCSCGPRR